jgi:hypothetical protein
MRFSQKKRAQLERNLGLGVAEAGFYTYQISLLVGHEEGTVGVGMPKTGISTLLFWRIT